LRHEAKSAQLKADVANGAVRDADAQGLSADMNFSYRVGEHLLKVRASRPLYLASIQLPA